MSGCSPSGGHVWATYAPHGVVLSVWFWEGPVGGGVYVDGGDEASWVRVLRAQALRVTALHGPVACGCSVCAARWLVGREK